MHSGGYVIVIFKSSHKNMFDFKSFISRIMGIGEVQRQSIVSLIWQIAYTFIGFLSTMYFAHAVGASVLGAYFLFLVV